VAASSLSCLGRHLLSVGCSCRANATLINTLGVSGRNRCLHYWVHAATALNKSDCMGHRFRPLRQLVRLVCLLLQFTPYNPAGCVAPATRWLSPWTNWPQRSSVCNERVAFQRKVCQGRSDPDLFRRRAHRHSNLHWCQWRRCQRALFCIEATRPKANRGGSLCKTSLVTHAHECIHYGRFVMRFK
jgi:hypothetical protein